MDKKPHILMGIRGFLLAKRLRELIILTFIGCLE